MSIFSITLFFILTILLIYSVVSDGIKGANPSAIFYYLIFFLLLISLYLEATFRYKIRQGMMRKLANQFKLNFFPDSPANIADFSVQPLYFNPKTTMNHIVGEYSGYKIHVYDMFIPAFGESSLISKKLFWSIGPGGVRKSSVEINGKKEKYGSFIFEGSAFVPVYYVRKKLKSLNKIRY